MRKRQPAQNRAAQTPSAEDLDVFAREMQRSFPFRTFAEHRASIGQLCATSRVHRLYVRYALWCDRRKPTAERRFV